MHIQHSADTDGFTFRPRIVERELEEKSYLEPIRKGSIHNRWQWDKRAC